MNTNQSKLFEATEIFSTRHIGSSPVEIDEMLRSLELKSLDELALSVVPRQILIHQKLQLEEEQTEFQALARLQELASKNKIYRSFIGMGYSDCITPPVIRRNILENPGWYTQYTPYQAEIAQGRLEALLNFQTMVMDLTGFAVANASMLDEATAAAEAMALCFGISGRDSRSAFFVSENCHPQTIAVVYTRAEPLGIRVIVGDHEKLDFNTPIFGALLQYPGTDGVVCDYAEFVQRAHTAHALVVVAADLMSLALLPPPGEIGADIGVGSTQRFGIPLGYGGPHAAYFATREEFKRQIPGRIVGLSQDVNGKPAVRLALQTREQHIRRDKATSNICTAQVLLAVMASMYAVYHGPDGIRRIASNIHRRARILKEGLLRLGYSTGASPFFDTVKVSVSDSQLETILHKADALKVNLRVLNSKTITISVDEVTSDTDLQDLFEIFVSGMDRTQTVDFSQCSSVVERSSETLKMRKSAYLSHAVFNSYKSETEMLRYIFRLQAKDLSLTTSMIPLGSCTMKLNATSEMLPITWPEFSRIHPFAPLSQVEGYRTLLEQLEKMLAEITGFCAVSLQPNAGSQGEYAGLLVIRKYHESRGEGHRTVCLIPKSAHGTNPASAVMAGMKVVVVECDALGNIDLEDLRRKAQENNHHLAALMVTYPSTHGVFEEGIQEVCEVVHAQGGQVYMDGANMNAQIGLCRPGEYGPDVCHLNLHKTFCIPHGGGGPGMGPIGVAKHLKPFLPGHPFFQNSNEKMGPVSAAPWGSASILPISWMYISMMGPRGLRAATQVAILNANYIAKRLGVHYPVLYRGKKGYVAHECIFDFRSFKESAGIEVEDVAKRLMDYGFHAPTVSFPVMGTLMVEPTESESKAEIDRFCEAMIAIREEIREIELGHADRNQNVLKNAPHTAAIVTQNQWDRPYSREKAAFPLPWVRDNKFWPSVGRINNVLGDRNLICGCGTG